jgi:hypothetical protein
MLGRGQGTKPWLIFLQRAELEERYDTHRHTAMRGHKILWNPRSPFAYCSPVASVTRHFYYAASGRARRKEIWSSFVAARAATTKERRRALVRADGRMSETRKTGKAPLTFMATAHLWTRCMAKYGDTVLFLEARQGETVFECLV